MTIIWSGIVALMLLCLAIILLLNHEKPVKIFALLVLVVSLGIIIPIIIWWFRGC